MIESSPILLAVIALLGVPGVTSLVVGLIRAASTVAGVAPETVVYVVSLALTAVIAFAAGDALPGLGDSGPATVAAWIAWATVNAKAAQAVYDILLSKLLPAPAV